MSDKEVGKSWDNLNAICSKRLVSDFLVGDRVHLGTSREIPQLLTRLT